MSNVYPGEIAKFGELAPRWWDKEGEFRPLHQINPLRLGWIESWVPVAGRRVLDVGCGGGILTDAMAHRGAQALGIDLAERALKVAELHALEAETPSISYRNVAVEALAVESPAVFDVVTCMEMLEHVPDAGSVVRACSRLVRPGGWVFFSTINRNVKAFAQAIVAGEYILGLLPRGTHEYAGFLRPSELSRMCRDAGLDVMGMSGLGYNPLTHRYAVNQDVGVNYMMACRKPT